MRRDLADNQVQSVASVNGNVLLLMLEVLPILQLLWSRIAWRLCQPADLSVFVMSSN